MSNYHHPRRRPPLINRNAEYAYGGCPVCGEIPASAGHVAECYERRFDAGLTRAQAERLAATDPHRGHDWEDCLMGACRDGEC